MPPSPIPDDMQMNDEGTVLARLRGAPSLVVYFEPAMFRRGKFDLVRLLAQHDSDLLFLGDPQSILYLNGVPGVADTYFGLVDWLGEQAAKHERTMFLGSSSGAGASLVLGERVGIAMTCNFGPFMGTRRDDVHVMVPPIPSWSAISDRVEAGVAADTTGEFARAAAFLDYLNAKRDGVTSHLVFSPEKDICDQLNGWTLRNVRNCHRFLIPGVLHPGITYAMRRGHLDDLLRIFAEQQDPGAAGIRYCRRYFDSAAEPASALASRIRQVLRNRRKRRFAAELKRASKS